MGTLPCMKNLNWSGLEWPTKASWPSHKYPSIYDLKSGTWLIKKGVGEDLSQELKVSIKCGNVNVWLVLNFSKNLLNIASISSCVCPTIKKPKCIVLKTPHETSRERYVIKYWFFWDWVPVFMAIGTGDHVDAANRDMHKFRSQVSREWLRTSQLLALSWSTDKHKFDD